MQSLPIDALLPEVVTQLTVATRIQELFGLTGTPRLAGGRVLLVIHLLATNQRPGAALPI